jgi:hypothetical protein
MTQALPRGRAEAVPYAAPRPDIPDQLWEDPLVDPVDVWLYGWLNRWSRLHPGYLPTRRQIGRAMRKSPQTAARSIDRLRAAGWISAGPDLRLTFPTARLAVAPPETVQGFLPGLDFGAESAPLEQLGRATGGAPTRLGDGFVPPHTPLVIEQEKRLTNEPSQEQQVSQSFFLSSEGKASEDEFDLRLIDRAAVLFTNATPRKVRAAIRKHGSLAVERALDVAQDKKPESIGYLLGILRNWEEEGIAKQRPPTLKVVAPEPPRAGRAIPPPLTRADMPGGDELAAIIDQASGHGTSAAMWRVSLRSWVEAGLMPADGIPPELLERGAKNTGCRANSAKSPRQPAGDPSRSESNCTVNQSPRQNQPGASPDQLPQ